MTTISIKLEMAMDLNSCTNNLYACTHMKTLKMCGEKWHTYCQRTSYISTKVYYTTKIYWNICCA